MVGELDAEAPAGVREDRQRDLPRPQAQRRPVAEERQGALDELTLVDCIEEVEVGSGAVGSQQEAVVWWCSYPALVPLNRLLIESRVSAGNLGRSICDLPTVSTAAGL